MLRLLLMIADLIAPVRLLMRRRRLMLTAVELLLLLLILLCRRAMRMFRTAGYRTGTAAVVGRAVHRSVVHGGLETRVPILPMTRRDDKTLRHVLVASDTFRASDVHVVVSLCSPAGEYRYDSNDRAWIVSMHVKAVSSAILFASSRRRFNK